MKRIAILVFLLALLILFPAGTASSDEGNGDVLCCWRCTVTGKLGCYGTKTDDECTKMGGRPVSACSECKESDD